MFLKKFLIFNLFLIFSNLTQSKTSTFEQIQKKNILSILNLNEEKHPEDKTIHEIRILRQPIFIKSEPFPLWLNIFHRTTQKHIIEHELLFKKGHIYQKKNIDETARHLKKLGIFSYVDMIAFKTKDKKKIGILVVTRDIWSLRVEQNFSIINQHINFLHLRIVERNFLGLNMSPLLFFNLSPLSYEIGQSFRSWRFIDKTILFHEKISLLFDRYQHHIEGNNFQIEIRKPFLTLKDKWQFSFFSNIGKKTVKQSHYNKVLNFKKNKRMWNEENILLHAFFGRQFSGNIQHRMHMGLLFEKKETFFHTSFIGTEKNKEEFATKITPTPFTYFRPGFMYTFFKPTYQYFYNINTYGQRETLRLGPAFFILLKPPLYASSQKAFSLKFYGNFAAYYLKTLFTLEEEFNAEYINKTLNQIKYQTKISLVLPPFFQWRLFGHALFSRHWHQKREIPVKLGGNLGLRGYKSDAFIKYNAYKFLAHLELRTLPIYWQSMMLGSVLFLDIGHLFNDFHHIHLHGNIGLGLRFQIPHLNKVPFAINIAIPIYDKGLQIQIAFGFRHVFSAIFPSANIEQANFISID